MGQDGSDAGTERDAMNCTNLDTADDQCRLDAHTPLPSVVCGTSHERP